MGRRKEKPPISLETPTGIVRVGEFVRYYREGWYYGHLEEIGTATVKIRRAGPKGCVLLRLITVPIEDVRTP